MSTLDVLLDQEGKKIILMGNEAIARGFLEGGLQVAASYPGTPSSEIMATLITLSKEHDIYVEWSVNEKVAAEVSIAASIAGLRSMVSMKGVGVNVASEPFQAFTYMGVKGGIVLVSADDVGCHSSHTEQDNRFFAREAYLPIFEPFDPREAKEMAFSALRYSEEWSQPIMLRITTRIAHTSADITLGKIPKNRRKGDFERLPNKWVNLPQNARKMRKAQITRMKNITKAVNTIPYNRIEESEGAEYGIIASGISYGYIRDVLNILGISEKVNLLKIGTPYPLPAELVEKLLSNSEKILVVEELEPFVEMQVRALANKLGVHIPITGKELLPLAGELSMFKVMEGVGKFMEIPIPIDREIEENQSNVTSLIPPRPPVLCPGCGHRSVFYAIKLAERRYKRTDKDSKGFIKPSDIGCYTLGFQSPLEGVDTNLCMGASIGVSSGFSKVVDEPVVCTIGDSTFFHAGIPPLLNSVFNKANITVLILDNRTTAMTGFQPHPGVGVTAMGESSKIVSIEPLVKACGVDFVRTIDAYNIDELENAILEGVKHDGTAVIIAHGLCRMLELREMRSRGEISRAVTIDYDICTDCRICIDKFGCPATFISDEKVTIDKDLCTGCGVCMQKPVCAKGAIKFCEEE